MKTPTTISLQLQRVIPIICNLCHVHTLYLIRQLKVTTAHEYATTLTKTEKQGSSYVLTMLVISHNQVADPQIFMNEVFNKTQEHLRLFSIHFTLKEALNKINYGCNFLNRVLNEGTLLYKEDNRLNPLGSYVFHPEVFKKIKLHWDKRMQHALYFEEKSTICDDNPSNYGRYLLLQKAIQQACLGLIYVYWEYQPSYFSLPYLLHFCGLFTDLPRIIYPKKSFRSQQVYSRLCHAHYNLNEKIKEDTTESYALKAEHLTYRFIQAAHKLGDEKLKELKKLHHKKGRI